jgi:hypothetical protein
MFSETKLLLFPSEKFLLQEPHAEAVAMAPSWEVHLGK